MKTLTVNAGRGTPIYIENNIVKNAGDYLRAVTNARKVCIISDTNVFPLYGGGLAARLSANSFDVVKYVFEAGEASKTMTTLFDIVGFLAENELTRNDLILALGGGVTGDLAGFAAAIYLRGIDYVQIPTSLLAQVDASVGGKTAVDLPQGKNLCGAFHQPLMVLMDPILLKTLPPRYYADGMAEAIKMGAIQSASLLEAIEADTAKTQLENILYECVRLKAAIVERDERDHGERALLNFGHTVGHAIERLYHYQGITHGEAVGIGMVTVCRAAEQQGLTLPGTADRIAAVLQQYGLPVSDNSPMEAIIDAMRADKKRTGTAINLIILKSIGNGVMYPVADNDIKAFFGVQR